MNPVFQNSLLLRIVAELVLMAELLHRTLLVVKNKVFEVDLLWFLIPQDLLLPTYAIHFLIHLIRVEGYLMKLGVYMTGVAKHVWNIELFQGKIHILRRKKIPFAVSHEFFGFLNDFLEAMLYRRV